jgi:MoxR-like ATPase
MAGGGAVTSEIEQDWQIYRGTGIPHGGIGRLPPPPPWRSFDGGPLVKTRPRTDTALPRHVGAADRAQAYQAGSAVVEMVNAALLLRRPLLVTGKPGTGKSTLAYSVALELGLGPVLSWPITSRSVLADALYRYDAVGRLQEAALRQATARQATARAGAKPTAPDIGRFVRLGPLGTALLPQAPPRVLLIDELDKSDIDLPNDLLHVFEEGGFVIPELARLPDDQNVVEVFTADGEHRVPVRSGRITCGAFPFIVISSNGEREFPPAFLRRCMRLDIKPPDHQQLADIVVAQLGEDALAASSAIIERFLQRREQGDIATDQLLNAIYLATSASAAPADAWDRLEQAVLRPLDTMDES